MVSRNSTPGDRRLIPHRRLRRLPSISNPRGGTLVAVAAIAFAVLLTGGALFSLGVGESDVVDHAVDSTRAFWIAEGGIERARAWLKAQANQTPPVYPAGGEFLAQPLGGGEYDAVITRLVGPDAWTAEYDVVSIGEFEGELR